MNIKNIDPTVATILLIIASSYLLISTIGWKAAIGVFFMSQVKFSD